MEPLHFSLPGYQVNEYMIVLSPHEELCLRIQKIKEEFAAKLQMPRTRNMRPHLGLVSFMGLDMLEDKLVHRLQHVALGMAPFKVEIKDFGSFPTHSIFLNVTSRLPVQLLLKELASARQLMRLNAANKPNFHTEPHIIIARRLKPWQYEQGWQEYSQRQFTGRFIADSMLLLKRRSGEKGAFQVAGRFEFMNLPVTTKQASLF